MGCKRFSGVILLVSISLAGLVIESPAMARQLNRRANKGAAKALAATEIINTLKSAEQLLVTADHDYDGHRALAAQEVHKALTELGHRHAGGKTGATGAANLGGAGGNKAVLTGQTKGRQPQAASDAQLRQAQQLLQAALTHIGARHPKAAGNVNAAIQQINTALAIK